MAIITSFSEGTRSYRRSSKEAEASYQLIDGDDGVEYLQIVTFGSNERQNVGMGSQNIRLDEERASELVQIIMRSFPSIRSKL